MFGMSVVILLRIMNAMLVSWPLFLFSFINNNDYNNDYNNDNMIMSYF